MKMQFECLFEKWFSEPTKKTFFNGLVYSLYPVAQSNIKKDI